MEIIKTILFILLIIGVAVVAIALIIDTFRPGDGSPEGYEIDWSRSWTLQTVYRPKPPKVIVVESKHDKETDTTTSVIIVPATINVSDIKIKVDNTVPLTNQPPTRIETRTTAEKTEKLRRFHEPNFDDITCREPSYDGMIGHEPDFNIDTYDEIIETVTVVKNIEPNYDSCDGHDPSYD